MKIANFDEKIQIYTFLNKFDLFWLLVWPIFAASNQT